MDAIKQNQGTARDWLTRQEAAALLNCSLDTVDRHRVPFLDDGTPPPKGKFRYRMRTLGAKQYPRIYRPDLVAIEECRA